MSTHEVDEFGHPVDPELRRLEFHLCDLASHWRFHGGDPDRQEEAVCEYHATMAKLYSLGWDAILPAECELPDEFLPDEYLRRHPTLPNSGWRYASYKKNQDK